MVNNINVSGDISNTVSCPNLLSHIEIFDINDNLHLPISNEVVVGLDDKNNPTIGIKIDILDPINIKKVVLHEGLLIPSYSHYQNNNDNWYMLWDDEIHYSSKDGIFYLGTNLDEIKYAQEFNEAFNEICSNYNGTDNNKPRLENKFYAFKNIYVNELTSITKNNLQNSDNEEILRMLETYIYVVKKYSLENFLNIDLNMRPFSRTSIFGESAITTVIIIIISIVSLSAISITGYIAFNRRINRHEEN